MDTYALIVLVALFLGVMGIIAMLERRRRTELAQFEQLHQTLTACLGSLHAIHSSGEAQMAQVAEALSHVRAAVETGTKSSSESAATLSSAATHAVEKAVVRLESALLQHQKAQDSTLVRAADKLSESAAARSKEVLAEAQRTTKAVEALKASLEASVKF